MKINRFFEGVYGFRILHALYQLIIIIENKKEGETSLEEKRIAEGLGNFLRCTKPELYTAIDKFRNTILYAYWDMNQVYSNSEFRIGKPTLSSSHDMPNQISQAYFHSMAELHGNCYFNLDGFRPYFQGKTVLDFGSGIGHYIPEFQRQNVKRLFMYDRPEVLAHSNIKKPAFVRLVESYDNLLMYKEHIDLVWLSLVIHTKPNPEEFMLKEVIPLVKKDGELIVNHLRVGEGYDTMFDLQTLSHVGCLWNNGAKVNHLMSRLGWERIDEAYTSDITYASVYTRL